MAAHGRSRTGDFRALKEGKLHPAAAKRRLAWEVVRMYHGEEAADEARDFFDRVHRDRKIPAPHDVTEARIPRGCANADGRVWLPRLLVAVGLAPSNAEARRLVAQGGVRLDGQPVREEELPLGTLEGSVLQVGRRNFVRLV